METLLYLWQTYWILIVAILALVALDAILRATEPRPFDPNLRIRRSRRRR